MTGSHTYAEEGSYTVTVVITDLDNAGNPATATTCATVADAPLTITRIAAVANQERQTLAAVTFTDADPNQTLSDYVGTIAWGDDKSSTAQTFTNPNGGFAAVGFHIYATRGSYTVTLTVKDAGAVVSKSTSVFVP